MDITSIVIRGISIGRLQWYDVLPHAVVHHIGDILSDSAKYSINDSVSEYAVVNDSEYAISCSNTLDAMGRIYGECDSGRVATQSFL